MNRSRHLAFWGACVLALWAAPAAAQFDWGESCTAGAGDFSQTVGAWETLTIGEIPAGQNNVRVELSSTQDVDVVLFDVATGATLVGWPSGLLRAADEACTNWSGVRICYSGYNGDQSVGGAGNEYISIDGELPTAIEMGVYGFVSGQANVAYRWTAASDCAGEGDGTFNQALASSELVEVGVIREGIRDVVIELTAQGTADLDLVLRDGATSLVEWPIGLLRGAAPAEAVYEGMTIRYSGYEGIDGAPGNERVEIDVVTRPLTMYAFGFEPGVARVDYQWGTPSDEVCVGDDCEGPVDDGAAFFEAFTDDTLSDRWRVTGGDRLEQTFADGWLSLRPTEYSVWFHELRGPALLTEVSGDFRITTRVRARDTAAPMWPVNSFFQFGGLLVRDPAGETGAAENWIFSVVGYRGAYNAIEQKSTVNGLSFVDETRWFGGDAELRICRVGQRFLLLQRAIGASEWSLGMAYEREGFPESVEIGLAAYSYTETPSLIAGFDYFDFTPIGVESECWLD